MRANRKSLWAFQVRNSATHSIGYAIVSPLLQMKTGVDGSLGSQPGRLGAPGSGRSFGTRTVWPEAVRLQRFNVLSERKQ